MTIENSTLALAGMFQAAELVRQAARENRIDESAFQATLGSLLKLDVATITEVYGGVCGVRLGLQTLCAQLDGEKSERNWELLRYVIELVFLERRFIKRADMLESVAHGVRAAQESGYGATHVNVIARLADIYSRTISTFNHRIHVHGEPLYLHDNANVNRIRALLLGGIRSAVLWQQSGGGRMQFMFQRGKILRSAYYLLDECTAVIT
jgi:high frequency lysogenization protein